MSSFRSTYIPTLCRIRALNPALICTLPDLCSFLGACADVLYRLTPTTPTTNTTPGPVNQASSLILITTTLHDFTFILLSHCRHAKVVNTLSGVAVLRSHCHGKAITGTAGGLCTPTGQPRFPAALVHTHLHQINACPLILAGPLSHS